MRLFREANFEITRNHRQHDAYIDDLLVEQVVFIRPQHIPHFVEEGICDIGICGLDCVVESMANVAVLGELPYGRGNSLGRTHVALFSSEEADYFSIKDIPMNSRILTEYPNITRYAFKRARIPVKIEFSYGGTEALIPSLAPFGVCLSDTGKSLRANGKKLLNYLSASYTALIANQRALGEKSDEVKALHLHLSGATWAREKVLLKMNVPAKKKDAVLNILPALKKPTITALSDGVSFAVESVVPKEDSTTLIVRLAQEGAEGIIELSINKIVSNW